IKPMDNVKLANWGQAHDLPLVLANAIPGQIGATAYLNTVYKTGGIRNVANLSDPQIDQMIDAQAAELKDANRRRDILYEIQRRLLDNAANVLALPLDLLYSVLQPQLRNVVGIVDSDGNDSAYWDEIWFAQ